MNNPGTVAVNIMVKNARDSVLRALDSVIDLIDEIVVFDTGSTDGTQEAIQNYLRQLPTTFIKTYREVAWIDDFSAIRNQMLEATTSAWVLALDADEVLTIQGGTLRDLTRSGHQVFFIEKRSYVKAGEMHGFIPVKDEYPEQEKGYVGFRSEPNYLFFEKNPLIHYERLIHESIELSLLRHKIPSVRINDIRIHNYGRHDMSTKGPWYYSLVKKLVSERPDDGLAWCYLGVHEKTEGNLPRAIECLDRSIALIPDFPTAKLFKAKCLMETGNYIEAERLLAELSRKNPGEEAIWLDLISATQHTAHAGEKIIAHLARAESTQNTTTAIYEAAAVVLGRLKKPVKAEIYRKRARELKRKLKSAT